ncbi:8-amino-7-oxononanoate synthase domain protein [Burkholderia mallei]|nr:8-amino-7-oxononanoate synthase domain protein [Burkholderia mallei]
MRGAQDRTGALDQRAEMRAARVAFVARDDREARGHRARDGRRRGRREDIAARALHEPFDHRFMRDDERARDARRLAERADVDEVRRAQPVRGERAAALRAEHAEAVRVVDDEPRAVCLGERDEARERRDVAVHAEHGVGDDQLRRRVAGAQARVERVGVAVRVDLHVRARQPRAVDQRRMIERVGEDRRAAARERGERGEVRHVAGAEVQRARRIGEAAGERGELVFERRVRARVAAEQMRAAAARAVAARAFGERFDEARMRGEPEIVVAREADDCAAVHRHVRAARGVRDAAAPAQPLRVDVGEALFERGERIHAWASDSVASSVARVREASHSISPSSRM